MSIYIITLFPVLANIILKNLPGQRKVLLPPLNIEISQNLIKAIINNINLNKNGKE